MRKIALALLFAACSTDPTIKNGRKASDYDALAQIAARKDGVKNGKGTLAHQEGRLGLPTFIWASRDKASASLRMPTDAATAARRHLSDYADRYRLSKDGVAQASLVALHDNGSGPIIATFKQEVDGVEVFRNRLAVVMDRHNDAIALSGFLSPNAQAGASDRLSFEFPASEALKFAYLDLTGLELGNLEEQSAEAIGAYAKFTDRSGASKLLGEARAKRVLFDLPDSLVPAYYIELDVGLATENVSDSYAYVIGARDGRLLFRKDLTDAAYSYAVWSDQDGQPLDSPLGKSTPHMAGAPDNSVLPFTLQNTLTVDNFPFSKNDPWLPANATSTFGNNVMAYADLIGPDGYSPGDLLPYPSAPGSFVRPYDPSRSADADQTQMMAAATSLFVVNNFLHDWYYDAGFDEAAGNAQLSNFGRGGVEGDPIQAQAQDFSGRNNANMSTPADGKSPRMQMFLFDTVQPSNFQISAPASIAGAYASEGAAFFKKAISVAGPVVLLDDGVAAANGGSVTDACELPFAANVTGKIIVVDRGLCAFSVKAANAVASGAAAMILLNNRPGPAFPMSGDKPYNLPAVMVEQATGVAIKQALAAGETVSVQFARSELISRDGTLDNLVVAHEWGHYISNRLIGNGAGLTGNHQRGLGEGYADFHGLLLTTRESDLNRPANDRYRGAYAMGAFAMGGQQADALYFGFRRVPYSVDFRKNPLTLKHITEGVALPESAPIAFGQNGVGNAEVHNTGEVWATMLWECYVALLQQTIGDNPRMSFEQAREKMKKYLVAAYKVTPVVPTILEARDALLAVAYANDPTDYVLFQQAFARRGAGLRSQAPDRFSNDNAGTIETFVSGNDVTIVDAQIAETSSKCPADGILDDGDTGTLTVTVKNVGTGFLSATSVTMSSPSPGVTFPNGATVFVDAMDPLQTATVQIPVALKGQTAITQVELVLAVTDPTLAFGDSVTTSLPVLANFDEVPLSSNTDNVEAPHAVWTTKYNQTLAAASWSRESLALDQHVFFGPSVDGLADLYLISPKLELGPGDTTISFSHTFAFEFDETKNEYFDGGVIELSTDGIDWVDIGASLYNATLTEGLNPIAGRAAFGGVAEGWPTLTPAAIKLGSAYANQIVQIRFRSASDSNSVSVGWLVDDISVNSTNKPFSTIVAELGCGL